MTMSFRARRWGVLVGTAVLTLSTATGALAADDPPPPPGDAPAEEPAAPEWPPADSDGEWLPLPEGENGGFSVEACGSTVTASPGDVDETEYQSMHQADGTIRVEFRGDSTLDVTRESDDATLDELEAGGPGYQLYSADGLTVTYSYEGPGIVGAFDEVEAAVFAGQGLPPVFYYETGTTTERVVFSEDPEAATIESAEFLTDTALGVMDVCDLLDAAAS